MARCPVAGTFWILFLRYTGFSQSQAAAMFAGGLSAMIVGNLLGGRVGDAMAARLPDTGRVYLAQASTLPQP